MKEVSKFAESIAGSIKDDSKDYAFDMGLIVIIGSIVINIIQLLVKCNIFGRSLEDRVKNPGPIDTILLRRAIKNKLTPEYIHLKNKIQEEILLQVKSLSSEKIKLMIEESKK